MMCRVCDYDEPERKPSKKEQIATLTERVKVQDQANAEMRKRHEAALEVRDQQLAEAGLVRAEVVMDISCDVTAYSRPTYTATVHLSAGTYKGLDAWSRKQGKS